MGRVTKMVNKNIEVVLVGKERVKMDFSVLGKIRGKTPFECRWGTTCLGRIIRDLIWSLNQYPTNSREGIGLEPFKKRRDELKL
jgi:hypothetical protein